MNQTHTATTDRSDRDRLICQNLRLIPFVVRRMLKEAPGGVVDFEDLVGYGTIGLIQAADRFDESLGIPFGGYAAVRIRGAVIDALRCLDPLSRGQRSTAKRIGAKQNELALALDREPTHREVCDATGLTPERFNSTRALAGIACVSMTNDSDDGLPFGFPEPAALNEPPTARLEEQQLLAALEHAIEILPERERLVVGLYYGEHLTHAEISTVMNISQSRVAQLVQQALGRLRSNSCLAEAALPCSDRDAKVEGPGRSETLRTRNASTPKKVRKHGVRSPSSNPNSLAWLRTLTRPGASLPALSPR